MENCCNILPNVSYISNLPNDFMNRLENIDYNLNFKELHKCIDCNQLWVIDAWDKYVKQIAIKVDNKKNWKKLNFMEIEYNLFIESNGGLENTKCIWKDCNEYKVKGFFFCVKHIHNN